MSEQNEHPDAPASERGAAGVLSNLPRTRPQRASARRLAARDGAGAGASQRAATRPPGGAEDSAAAGSQSAAPPTAGRSARKRKADAGASARSGATRSTGAARKTPAPRAHTAAGKAPKQGFESDADSTSGPVLPPGGAELLSAASELLTEVAKSGISRGTSTLRGILGRLHLS